MLFLRIEKSFHTNALAVRSRGTRVAHETAGGREGRHFRRLLLLSPLGEGERRVREGAGGAGGGGGGGGAGGGGGTPGGLGIAAIVGQVKLTGRRALVAAAAVVIV